MTCLEDIYHINLGIDHKEEVIKNTITISREQPIVVLTGANRGGKTTITQTMCITMWFAQLGFFVPGTKVSLPYVSELLVHFPKEESEAMTLGASRRGMPSFQADVYESQSEQLLLHE